MKTLEECKLIARTSDLDWLGEEMFRLQGLAANLKVWAMTGGEANAGRKRLTDEKLTEVAAANWDATLGGVFYVQELAELATEVLAARKRRRDDSQLQEGGRTPDHVGHDGAWVSGQLQVTTQVTATTRRPADTTYNLPSYTLCMYWREQDDGCGGRKVYWVDFELFEVIWKDDDGILRYQLRGSPNSPDPTGDLDHAEVAASGFVKWDGCTQFQVADVHVDGRGELEALFSVIEEVRRRCAQAMPWSDVASEYADG